MILEVPTAEADAVVGRTYEDQDFRALYEREYRAHQHTKAELARVRDHAAYLEARVQKLEGDIAYLKKLLFSKKTEQQPSSGQSAPAPDPNQSPKNMALNPDMRLIRARFQLTCRCRNRSIVCRQKGVSALCAAGLLKNCTAKRIPMK
jgi:hypothetical protein